MNLELWEQLKDWKDRFRWVDLSHEMNTDTPHWDGFPTMGTEALFDFTTAIFQAHKYSTVGQFGTHVDPPAHFIQDGRTLEAFTPAEMVLPLCVIDKSETVKQNHDYELTVDDIKAFEAQYGEIPRGAFAAFRSDWSKRGTAEKMDNRDAQGNKHYPGWSVAAIKYLVEERGVAAIGHETSDTDPAVLAAKNDYEAERYILGQDRYQIELLRDLDQCPAVGALIFCAFPKLLNGSGFPARCFALCPR